VEFRESTRIAIGALRANKLRSFLTLLGTIVGVTAVIALISLIQGANTYVSSKLAAQGTNVFWVDKFGLILDNDKFREALKRKDLTPEDGMAVAATSKLAAAVRVKKERTADVRYGSDHLRQVPIQGMWGDYVAVDRIELQEGRHLTSTDIARRRSTCVLGYEVWEKLFKDTPATGRQVRIGENSFDVVGVAEKKGDFLGQSQDNFVIVPLGASDKIYGKRGSVEIGVLARDPSTFQLTQDEVRAILRARRHDPPGKDDDFGITTPDLFMDLYKSLTGAIFIVFVGVAAISLVVGGIVIMNIMMVSVTERTREIGIRKALGAKKKDILMQFLVEASTLSFTGGAIGVILGSSLALAVSAVSPLPATVSVVAIILGLVMSTSIGLIFGIYPAMRAARLDPIVALRFE